MSLTATSPRTMPSEPGLDDKLIRPLMRDLHKAKQAVYWADLLTSGIAGWAFFYFAVRTFAFSLRTGFLVAGAVFCLYRALCFVHELSHQSARNLPGLVTAYDLLIGFPLLMPSFVYVGMHQSHHRIDVYGTDRDPEYLPFSRSWLMTTVFATESFAIPLILLLRFVLLTPVGLLSPRFHRWLTVHLSSLTMNPKYRRTASPELLAKVRNEGAVIFLGWGLILTGSAAGWYSWHWLAVWFAVEACISFINCLRTLGAHAYESDGQPMDREAQLRDSIDTPGAFWTELWAPVGLRYHALHHYFPGIPYHNLPEAYRRIVHYLPVAESYRNMSSPSLPHSLQKLLGRGWRSFFAHR